MMRWRRQAATWISVLALGLELAGCGGGGKAPPPSYQVRDNGQANAGGVYKVGKPYQIQGVWYYPGEDYGYDETGVASWYGPDFHGKYTANGEIFNQDDVTAAHRTLPMPSIVRVTNLENGRSILVRVNDRGPFAHGRILDLSKHAAELLGLDLQGTARVRVRILADESRMLALQLKGGGEVAPLEAAPRVAVQSETLAPPAGRSAAKAPAAPTAAASAARPARSTGRTPPAVPPPPAVDEASLDAQTAQQGAPRSTQLFIQAGAFSRYDYASRLSAALSAVGPAAISQVQTKQGALFRVRLGPIPSLTDADALLERVIASGYPDARLVAD